MKYGIIFILCLTFFQVQATVGYKVGNTAPEFKLKSLDNTEYSLSGLRKKGHVLLVFWAVECVYCYAHIKEFNAAHEKFKTKLTIAAINIGGEYPVEVAEYVKKTEDSEIDLTGFIKKFVKLNLKEAKELRKKIEKLEFMKVGREHIVKIIDFMPENAEDLNKIFVDVSLNEDETRKILETVKEFK